VPLAVEGPTWIVEDIDDVAKQSDAARAVESERTLMSATARMIAIGQRLSTTSASGSWASNAVAAPDVDSPHLSGSRVTGSLAGSLAPVDTDPASSASGGASDAALAETAHDHAAEREGAADDGDEDRAGAEAGDRKHPASVR
jgi:hypothetical protein